MSSEAVPVEEALSRAQQRASPLYTGRVEVYAKAIKGRFRSVKWIALVVLLGIYYLTPWLRWDRGPDAPNQAVLADMAGGKLYFFSIEIWPQEVYFLTGILILAAFGLFLATSLFGRLWCGFACPQTVWTDLFMQVERWIEGDRAERIRFDKAPWTAAKWRKRVLKHAVWLLIAFLTGGAWIMYFRDAPTVIGEFFTGQAGVGIYFFVFLFTGTTYLLAGMAREQVCTYMCPWPRIQGALVDKDTMAVTYEAWRGEPRGKYRKGEEFTGRGDCIDCHQCVAVCPMGIDIRDGVQMECIQCALCVDACDDIMAKVGRPKGLISYETFHNMEALSESDRRPVRFMRPRTILYSSLIAVVLAIMGWAWFVRAPVEISVIEDRNPLFVRLSDGGIRNGYTLKILNKSHARQQFGIAVEGLPETQIAVLGQDATGGDVQVEANSVRAIKVFVTVPVAARTTLKEAAMPLRFVVTDRAEGKTMTRDTSFRSPGP